ncbi:6958_t:CDS:1, partial [Paraglomus brasilianum]
NAQKHLVEIGGFGVDATGKRVVVVATIDNLKGAATPGITGMYRSFLYT